MADFRPERAWGEWKDGWTDRWNDEQNSPCVLQDFVPFGAAALLPLFLTGCAKKSALVIICSAITFRI